jgi:hypothetical protein
MATRKPKKTEDQFIKALNPRDVDQKYMGEEPFFPLQPEGVERRCGLARSFAWYHRFYGKKDARELMAQYLDFNTRPEEAKQIRRVPESDFLLTLCWLARMNLRGLELTEHEDTTLENEIARLIQCLAKPTVKEGSTITSKEEASARPNIQEVLREKAREAAGELEGMFDEFIIEGAKLGNKFKPIDHVAKKNVMPQHISILTDVWKKKQSEFEQVLAGKDAQLVEGYNRFTKTQIKNIIKFIEQVISDLNSYISVKKASKAPRTRKLVPVEKIVAKLKYLKVFKDPAAKLDLLSIHPTKLHGASECYLYDSAKRKLIYLCADEYSKTFTVKGTTVLGFDTSKSQTKTLRKPGEQLKELMSSGRPVSRKFFTDIKSVGTTPNGRTNENMIILKAW